MHLSSYLHVIRGVRAISYLTRSEATAHAGVEWRVGSSPMVSAVANEPSAPVASQVRGRLDYLDGLRALAALYVVFTHMADEVWSVQNHHEPTGCLSLSPGGSHLVTSR